MRLRYLRPVRLYNSTVNGKKKKRNITEEKTILTRNSHYMKDVFCRSIQANRQRCAHETALSYNTSTCGSSIIRGVSPIFSPSAKPKYSTRYPYTCYFMQQNHHLQEYSDLLPSLTVDRQSGPPYLQSPRVCRFFQEQQDLQSVRSAPQIFPI